MAESEPDKTPINRTIIPFSRGTVEMPVRALGIRPPPVPHKPPDVGEMIAQLQEQAQRLLSFTHEIDRKAAARGLKEYRDLQERVMQFDSFAALIETQLIDIKFRGKEDLRRKFDDITLLILSALIGAKLKYLQSMARRPIPLGTRRVFEKELRAIRGAADKLTDPEHRSRLSDDAMDNIKLSESVLIDIIGRATDLRNFG